MKLRIKKCKVGLVKGVLPVMSFELDKNDYDAATVYDGRDLDGYQISITKPRRSKDANAYMWELIGQIADKAGETPNVVYRTAVREAGVWFDGYIANEDFESFCEDWADKGIGWWVEADIVGTYKTSFRAYRGSSVYNSTQMSRLIDNVVDTAHFYNIETDTPNEIAKRIALWGA